MIASQIATWWFTSTLLGLAGLPLSNWLFRTLPDRGYAFSRAFGLLLVGYLAWLLSMLGLSSFSGGLLTICAIVVLGIGLLVQRGSSSGTPGVAGWLGRFFPGWRLTLGYEALFLAALVFEALIRARMPDPWGTERPMDFAFFNAIQRSGSFPPHDPWMAGLSINYYYLGYLLMASVALLAGLEPAVGYNLSLALIFALTALGIAGIVVNLMRLTEQTDESASPSWRRGAFRSLFVLLSVVFVLLAGNQGGLLEVVTGSPQVLSLGGQDMLRAIQNGLGPRDPLSLKQPFTEWGANDPTTLITPSNTIENFNWWNPSRALWDSTSEPDYPTKYYAITEFPMFSFWLGDMHPHVMALPFGLLAIALALAQLARRSASMLIVSWRGWLEVVLSGVVIGSLYAINSWDFPTYLLLYLAALIALYVRLAAPLRQLPGAVVARPRWGLGLIWQQLLQHVLLVGMASFLMLMPFYMTFRSLVGGKDPLIDLPLIGSFTRIVGFVVGSRTSLHTFVIIFGLFFVPLVAFIFAQARRVPVLHEATISEPSAPISEPSAPMPRSPEVLGFASLPTLPSSAVDVLPWVVLLTLPIGIAFRFPLLFLLPLAAYAYMLALREERPGVAFALIGAGLGALVCFGTELFYIRDVFEGGASRMNTIFKFYYQVWMIWGTLSGYALWFLLRGSWSLTRRIGVGIAVGLTVLLFAGALVYPWFTAFKGLREQPAIGLDGKTPRQRVEGGEASITWLREHANGNDVILEGIGDSYDSTGMGFAGVSASTGLATVMGWPGHEDQWRGGDPTVRGQIQPRRDDVDIIYNTTDANQARQLLDKYRVTYIYIGAAERSKYDPVGLDKFAQFGSPVFNEGEVTIYKINR